MNYGKLNASLFFTIAFALPLFLLHVQLIVKSTQRTLADLLGHYAFGFVFTGLVHILLGIGLGLWFFRWREIRLLAANNPNAPDEVRNGIKYRWFDKAILRLAADGTRQVAQ